MASKGNRSLKSNAPIIPTDSNSCRRPKSSPVKIRLRWTQSIHTKSDADAHSLVDKHSRGGTTMLVRQHPTPEEQFSVAKDSDPSTAAQHTSVGQIEANQKNALHSTGPTTPEGKQRSRLNALKHGLRAKEVIIPGRKIPRSLKRS